MLTRWVGRAAPVFILAGLGNAALAAADGADVERGKDLAVSRCAACHTIGSGPPDGPQAKAPSFATIASRPEQSADKLLWSLVFPPHPEMPDVSFSNNELRHIIAYILSLKTDP